MAMDREQANIFNLLADDSVVVSELAAVFVAVARFLAFLPNSRTTISLSYLYWTHKTRFHLYAIKPLPFNNHLGSKALPPL